MERHAIDYAIHTAFIQWVTSADTKQTSFISQHLLALNPSRLLLSSDYVLPDAVVVQC